MNKKEKFYDMLNSILWGVGFGIVLVPFVMFTWLLAVLLISSI